MVCTRSLYIDLVFHQISRAREQAGGGNYLKNKARHANRNSTGIIHHRLLERKHKAIDADGQRNRHIAREYADYNLHHNEDRKENENGGYHAHLLEGFRVCQRNGEIDFRNKNGYLREN